MAAGNGSSPKEEPLLFIPSGVEKYRKHWEKYDGGICGPACLGVVMQWSVFAVLDMWKMLFGAYKGNAPHKQMKKFLQHVGKRVVQQSVGTSVYTEVESDVYRICRVQWIGEGDPDVFDGWKYWMQAAQHTHYIVIRKGMVYCDVEGWFPLSDLGMYLNGQPGHAKGRISSYLEVSIR